MCSPSTCCASAAGAFTPLGTPVRVYDSRPGQRPAGVTPKTPLATNTPRTLDLTVNGSGVPPEATACLVNLVATNTTAAGFLSVYTAGIPWPGTSNVNFAQGETTAVTTLTAVDGAARCQVRANVVTDVVVDLLGYYL